MTLRFFAWIIAASLGLAPAGLQRMLPDRAPPGGEMRVAPQPVRDPDAGTTEPPIEYVARAGDQVTQAAPHRI